MRRPVAIGAAALIVVLALSLCCLAPPANAASSCCKGHCALAPTSPPISAIAPAKSVPPRPPAIAVTILGAGLRPEHTALLEPVVRTTWQYFDPIAIIQLRI